MKQYTRINMIYFNINAVTVINRNCMFLNNILKCLLYIWGVYILWNIMVVMAQLSTLLALCLRMSPKSTPVNDQGILYNTETQQQQPLSGKQEGCVRLHQLLFI